MTVRAKFILNKSEEQLIDRPTLNEDGSLDWEKRKRVVLKTLKFSPVSYDANNNENSQFWDASPSGELSLGVVNQEAWEHFELGKSYYLDFIPADEN